MRIEIAGALGVGKTTLAEALREAGFHVVYEDLSANPYLQLRREDPDRYEYLCQGTFVEDKISAIGRAIDEGHELVLSDFSLDVERAYLDFYLAEKPDWLEMLDGRIEAATAEFGPADVILHLRCAPEIQLERIRSRGREFEQGHDIGFIRTINGLVADRVAMMRRRGVPVIEVDASETIDADAVLARLGIPSPGRSTPELHPMTVDAQRDDLGNARSDS